MAALKRPIFDFLNQIFEPTRYHANATLRGFYFTSGTQHGTPIDRLIGALAKNFGAEQLGAQAYSGLGKSYFLTDLILKVIIGEAAWVSTDRAAVRRARIIKACLYATVALCAVGMTGLWWVSYTYNRELISSTQYTAANYEQEAGSLAHETIIGDHDMAKVRQPLFTLRNLPTGYENRKTSQPLLGTWGLSQRDRLRTSSEQVYHVGLERLSRPRLMFRLEEVLRAKVEEVLRGNRSNSGDIYEALKVYMMIAGVVRMEDRDLVISWMRNDWAEQLYLGAGNAEGRKALEAHLVAMLDLQLAGDDQPLVEPDLGLIAECQRILARQNIAERAYQLLKSQSRQSIAPDWVASEAGGPDFATVFEAASANGAEISVPGFYTYAGFQRAFIDKLPTIAEQLKRDNWVLGDVGKLEAITSQYGRLTGELLNIYERDFAAAWEQALNKLRLRSITADRPKYIVLSAAAAPTSPIRQLLESIVNETALTRERAPDKDKKEAPKPAPLSPRAGVPGAAVEARFKPFRQVLEGGGSQRTIDSFIGSLFEINNTLQRLNLNPDQKQQATAELRVKVATLRNHAELFPPPFREELSRWVRELEATVAGGTQAEIREDFANSVVPACREYVEGKYPLVRGAPREATPAEFGKVFGKDQVFDSFFERRLKSYVDTSKAIWTWKKDNPVSADFSPDTARQFQRARNIKDAFFGTGGLQPSFLMSVTPSPIGAGFKAKLVVNGTPVESPTQQSATAATPAAPPNPQTIPWVASPARSFIEIKADVGGQVVTAEGMPSGSPWSFFRLLDIVGSPKGNGAVAKYSGYGQVAEYQFTPQTLLNPLLLPDLREFKCPKVL
jgi:type VI secretion system protein ImpL